MANVSHATIHVINGEELGETPQASVHMLGKRGLHGGETLLVFLDLPGATPQMCADITRALTDGYSRAPGGVTSALRLAVKLANDRVLQLNKGATHKLEGSISCAVVGADSVVLAQCGPAIAFVRAAAGAFERIGPQGAAAQQVVGVTANIDVSFDNVAHQPGTVYVLTGDRSFVGQNDGLVNVCMSKGDPRMVAGYLNANIKQGRMSGVAFGVGMPEKASRPAQPAPEPVLETSAGRNQRDEEPELDAVAERSGDGRAERGGRFAGAAAATAATASEVGSNVKDGLNQAAQSVKRSLTAFGGKMLPDTAPLENKAQRSKTAQFLLIATAVLLPIIVVSIAVPLYYQFSGEAEKRETQRAITALIETARASSAPNDVKTNWTTVEAQVKAYQEKYPDDAARFAEARTQSRAQLDGLIKIVRVQANPIVQFEAVGSRRIAASALGVYALNTEMGVADYLPLNNDRTALNGKPVSLQFTGSVSGSLGLSDIAWATNTGSRWRTEGSVMFAPTTIYEYSSATGRAGPITVPAVGDARPGKLSAGELYNNQVYLLDVDGGQIWRYPIGPEGLGAGSTYFRSAFDPIKQGIDIGIDGAIYILLNNGSIQKFFNRQPQNFALSGVPEPIGRSAALAISGDDPTRGNVYLLDAQAGSVLQFDKAGQFVKQFRGNGDEFVNATDMSYDAASNTVYIVTGQRLYSFKPQ